jgi:hypothetical protein
VTIRASDAPIARAASTKSRAQRQHLAAHDAREQRPRRERDDRDDDGDARREQPAEAALAQRARRGQPEREQQQGEGEHRVGQAREHRVDPAPVVAGEQAGDRAHDQGEAGRGEGHEQRGARAVQHPREHVAALVVDAEQVLGARPVGQAERVAVGGRRLGHGARVEDGDDERRREGREGDRGEERQRAERDAVAAQAAPDGLGRRACVGAGHGADAFAARPGSPLRLAREPR